jgi:Ca-activated chloride channel family protein
MGKADPRLSTSGLEALIVGAYAAAGKTDRLTAADLGHSWVERFTRGVEAAVGRYGESPRRFLDNLYRADVEGLVTPEIAAVLVEEKAVIDYNRGDPAGRLAPGETGTRPSQRLVAVYPDEGTVYEDGPLVVLDAPWSTAPEQAAARRFVAYVRSPAVQRRVVDYGFRPADPGAEVEGGLFTRSAYGVEPAPDVPELAVPDAETLDALRTEWRAQRRPARALLVVDVSGSMGDPTDIHRFDSPTKLALAKQALTGALARFGGDDEVGLWVFSTALAGPGTSRDGAVRELVPVGRMGARDSRHRRSLANAVGALRPRNDTALYAATEQAHAAVVDGADPGRINAVVLITDGHDEIEGTPAERRAARRTLLARLTDPGSGGADGAAQAGRPVPVFTIAYGGDADAEVLQDVADATDGAFYDSTDPTTIDQVVTEALSNL